jgi:hypothetical protein
MGQVKVYAGVERRLLGPASYCHGTGASHAPLSSPGPSGRVPDLKRIGESGWSAPATTPALMADH